MIYPIAGGWEWNGGWLNDLTIMPAEFIDFAGSSIVHSVGGWAALVAAFYGWSKNWKVRERKGYAYSWPQPSLSNFRSISSFGLAGLVLMVDLN